MNYVQQVCFASVTYQIAFFWHGLCAVLQSQLSCTKFDTSPIAGELEKSLHSMCLAATHFWRQGVQTVTFGLHSVGNVQIQLHSIGTVL